MRIYAVNLNENCAFQKINREKYMKFADFRPINRIFTQPIAIKGSSFTDFRRYDRVCMQPIAKKRSCISQIQRFGGKENIIWLLVFGKKKKNVDF